VAGVVIAVAAWALLAFAGAYRWTTVPIFVAAGLLAGLVRPIPFTPPHRLLDVVLVASVGVIGVQLIPLPPALRTTLAPAAAAVDRALLLNSGSDDGAARPLSIDPESTFWSLGLGVALLLIFWSARTLFERHGGLRTVSRGVAFLGLGLAALVFLQRALSPRLIYGIWQPLTQSNASPWGPFVNRNDAAMWFVMALPLAAGYALARLESRRATAMKRLAPDEAFDAVMAMLLTSVSLMTAAVLTSLSRSGGVSPARRGC
jgi:hypothetical protein